MEEITKNLTTGKLVLGTKQTVKALRKALLDKIFLAENCPDLIVEDIKHYSELVQVPVEQLTVACDELGAVCKKPFMVSVVGVLK